MENILDIIAGALKGVGAAKAKELGRELRGALNDKVASTSQSYDDDLVEVLDSFVEGFADDGATNEDTDPADDTPAE